MSGETSDTSRIADFVVQSTFEMLPLPAVNLVKQALLDTAGVGIGGTQTNVFRIALEWIRQQGGRADSSVIGGPMKTTAALAAFANGVAIHALDFDDANHPSYAHPSCVLFPSSLALGEPRGLSGRDLILAYLVGFEIEARLGAVLSPSHTLHGWHSTCTMGTMGAVAASAKVLRLSKREVTMALGIAASSASGLVRNFGTMVKPYHAGHAAHNGVVAASLAALGLVADTEILEGRYGFYDAFQGDEPARPQAMTRDLGASWAILALPGGWSPKPFASCGGTHNTIQAVLNLREEHRVDPIDVVAMDVGVNRMSAAGMLRHDPVTGHEGQYSLEYCAAGALIYGAAGPGEFTDAKVRSPEVRALMKRVRVSTPPELQDEPEHPATVTLHLRDGRSLTRAEHLALGKPQNPMSRERRVKKFRDCTEGLLHMKRQDELIAMIDDVENLPDVSGLLQALTLG